MWVLGPTVLVVFAEFAGCLSVADTALTVVMLVVEVLLEWIVNVRCVLVVVQLSRAEQQPLRVVFLGSLCVVVLVTTITISASA